MTLHKDPAGCPCCHRRVQELKEAKKSGKGEEKKASQAVHVNFVFVNK